MTGARTHLGAVLAGVAVLAVAAAAPANANPTADSPRTQLQRELDAVVAAGATSAIAQVVHGRHRVQASSGIAELGSPRPAPANGRFRVGSVTKAFVGTVVLQLVAERRLGLDDNVDDVLRGVLPEGSGITVRELLNHTSGIPDVLTTFPQPITAQLLKLRWRTWSPRDLVARVVDQPLLFKPGTQASYSNTNYLLLGLVIEHLTGQPYATAANQRIIEPLRLNHTLVPGSDPFIHGPHAHGYLPVPGGDGSLSLVDITAFNPTLLWAGGEMISTTEDLNRFFEALLGGRLLPAYLMKQMQHPALDSQYGLSIIRRHRTCGPPAWGKDGDAPGYSTWSFTTPDDSRHVTVSVTWGRGDPGDAVDRLLDDELCS